VAVAEPMNDDKLGELAAGTDLGRRLSRLERRMGLAGAKIHWAHTADGFWHVMNRAACPICPPPPYRRVSLIGPTAFVGDTRAPGKVPAAETAEREEWLATAKELNITGRIGKHPPAPDPQPQEDSHGC